MTINTDKYKALLEEELKELEEELSDVGFRDPDNPNDWVPKGEKMNILESDENEVADTIEEYEENSGVLKQLEIRWGDVKAALERIEKGTYGIDEVDGEPIPEERLDANPAARTKIENVKKREE